MSEALYFYEGKHRTLNEIRGMCRVMNRQSRFKIVKDFVSEESNWRLLDVGCGVGNLSEVLAFDCTMYVGFDLLEEDIKIARLLNGSNFNRFTTKMSDLGRNYNVICALEVLEHQDNPGLFLQKWKKYLGKDGVLILSVPNLLCVTNMLFNLKYRNRIIESYDFNGTETDHVVGWDKQTLQNLLVKNGFEILRIQKSKFTLLGGQSIIVKAKVKT